MPISETASQLQPDAEFDVVFAELANLSNLSQRITQFIRKAIDTVLQGDRTARYSINQLTPEEKKHIGTQVECGFKRELFEDRQGVVLDTTVAEVEMDIKNTIGDTWMIPPEAVEQLCLLTQISEKSGQYSVGLIRAGRHLLNAENQDKKRSLSKEGRAAIRWVLRNEALPVSTFLISDTSVSEKVFNQQSGQKRVAELFRQVRSTPIQRSDIEAVAAGKDRQVDVRARVRDSKTMLRGEGLLVLRGWNPMERKEADRRGFQIDSKQCICIPLEKK